MGLFATLFRLSPPGTAVARQNFWLSISFCAIAQLCVVAWPWVWEFGLQCNPGHRIRRALFRSLAIGGICMSLGQCTAAWMDKNGMLTAGSG